MEELPTMFVSLPSYPPRPHARSWVQDPASPQQLSAPHPAPITSSAASRGSSLRAPQDIQQSSQLTADRLLLEPLSSWKSNIHSPTHSDEHVWQLLAALAGDSNADAGAYADEALLAWLDADSQLAAACVAPALPVGDCTAASHEAALVAISRALSLTLLDSDAAAGAFRSSELGLERLSSGGPALEAALSSDLGQQRSTELAELSAEEFAAMAAEFLPLERAQAPQKIISSGDDTATEACDVFLTAPSELDAYLLHEMTAAEPPERSFSADLDDGVWAWQPSARERVVPEVEFPLGDSRPDRKHSLAETLDSDIAALSSAAAGSEGGSLAQLPSDSDASDARSDLPLLSQRQPEGTPSETAPLPAAAPDSADSKQGTTSAPDGGTPVRPGSTSSAGRRRRRAAAEPPLDERSKLERSRQQQREYVKRKRVGPLSDGPPGPPACSL